MPKPKKQSASKCRILVNVDSESGRRRETQRSFPFSADGMRRAAAIANGITKKSAAKRRGDFVVISVGCDQPSSGSGPSFRAMPVAVCNEQGCWIGGRNDHDPAYRRSNAEWTRRAEGRKSLAGTGRASSRRGTKSR